MYGINYQQSVCMLVIIIITNRRKDGTQKTRWPTKNYLDNGPDKLHWESSITNQKEQLCRRVLFRKTVSCHISHSRSSSFVWQARLSRLPPELASRPPSGCVPQSRLASVPFSSKQH